jgi:hypothetical protein
MYANHSIRNGPNRSGFLAIMLIPSLLAPAALSRAEYVYTEARVEDPPGTPVSQDTSEASSAQYAQCESSVQYNGSNEATATAISHLDAPNGLWQKTTRFSVGNIDPGVEVYGYDGTQVPGTEGLTMEYSGDVPMAKIDWWRVNTFNRPGNIARGRVEIFLDGIAIFHACAELDHEGNLECDGFFEPGMFNVWLDGDLWVAEYVGPPGVEVDLPPDTPLNIDFQTSMEVRLTGPSAGELPECVQQVSLELPEGGEFIQSEFHEDFDSYETCTPLPDQSGWEPWNDNPARADFYATHAQSHSGSNAVAIDNEDGAVYRLNGYTEGVWDFSARLYVPEEMDDDQTFILLNTYPAPENCHQSLRLRIKGGLGVIRDIETQAERPLVKGDWSEIKVVIDLDQDQQSVYYNGDLLVTKSWTAGVEPGGALNIAAVDLWAYHSPDVVYYDDISLTPSAGAPCAADIDEDGDVDTADLLTLLAAWGACP